MISKRLLSIFLLAAACAAGRDASAQKVTSDEFSRTVDETIRLGDEKRTDKALRENPIHAVGHFRALVLAAKKDPAVDNAAEREALRASWERVFEGRTLELLGRWLETADSSILRSYDQGQSALAKAYGELNRLTAAKEPDRKSYETLRDSLMKIAELFEGIGDPLDAADAWGVIARVYSIIPDRSLADQREGIYAIERFMDLREQWQWTKDVYFQQNQNWMKAEKERLKEAQAEADKRKAEGYDGPMKGVDSFLMPDAEATEVVSDLAFHVLKEPKLDLCPQGGPIPMAWPAVTVIQSGPASFQWFKGADIYLVRPGATDFGVTLVGNETDLSKNPFTEVDSGNKLKKPGMFALDAEGNRRYAMWFFTGGSQEPYMGVNQNLEPTRDSAVVYYKSASVWTAEVDGQEIQFFDDNTNGLLFEEDPFAYGLKDRNLGAGPDEEIPVPAFDSVQIGKATMQPFSEWMQIGDGWYHVRGKEDGAKVGFRRANPEYLQTGTLKLDWKGSKATQPAVLIVQGRGDFRGARFNLAGGKPLTVPAGEYELMFGRIESGKGAKLMTANIFPGMSEKVLVEPGKEASIVLGDDIRLDFTKKGADGTVTIDAVTIRVRGGAGEIYTHINGAAPAPVVFVARGEDGKGAREVGEFQSIRDPETLNQVSIKHSSTLSSHVGFYPIPKGSRGETALEVQVPDGYFVGLAEKKNKLFGKLEAIYR
ncbi:MAG: hypothetical protein O3C51_00060 [Planctomycetota bacterium]|nr:hypothetical protein [Planctomycetota bacterium]